MAPGRHSMDRAWPGDSQTLCCPHGASGPLGEIRAWLGVVGFLTLGSREGREGVQEWSCGWVYLRPLSRSSQAIRFQVTSQLPGLGTHTLPH